MIDWLDDRPYRTVMFAAHHADQVALVAARRGYLWHLDELQRPRPIGLHLRDTACAWLQTTWVLRCRFMLRAAVLKRPLQADDAAHAKDDDATIAQAQRERWHAPFPQTLTRCVTHWHAIVNVDAEERHALLMMLDRVYALLEAAVAEAEGAWRRARGRHHASRSLILRGLAILDTLPPPPDVFPTMPEQNSANFTAAYYDDDSAVLHPRHRAALLTTFAFLPAHQRHLTQDGRYTLCGVVIAMPYQISLTFGRAGCKPCLQRAAQKFLVCVQCHNPIVAGERLVYCPRCRRHYHNESAGITDSFALFLTTMPPAIRSQRKEQPGGCHYTFWHEQWGEIGSMTIAREQWQLQVHGILAPGDIRDPLWLTRLRHFRGIVRRLKTAVGVDVSLITLAQARHRIRIYKEYCACTGTDDLAVLARRLPDDDFAVLVNELETLGMSSSLDTQALQEQRKRLHTLRRLRHLPRITPSSLEG